MPSTYLTRTISDGGNTKSTFSAWVKRSGVGTTQYLFHTSENTNNDVKIIFNSANNFRVIGVVSGSTVMNVSTNRIFRDTSAWYHFVVTIDLTQSTEADRVKIYVNGVQETSFSTAVIPSQDYSSLRLNNNGDRRTIGTIYDGGGSAGSGYFDGLMSHVHWIDGTAYQASTFGSTDTTTGEWKINASPTLTMGTNGFTILKDGNTITDQSANSNDFTLGAGTITDLKDNPSHNFCNINGLYNQTLGQGVTINNCGNTVYYASDSSRSCFGSIAPSSGKYYFECKVFSNSLLVIGIVNMAWTNLNGASGYAYHDDALNFGINYNGEKTSGGTNTAFGSAISNNDIVQVAMDLDNSKLYFGINGTWQNSGDPTSGSTGTGSAFNLASGANYTAACRLRDGTQLGFNFGNGQFSGSSVVASEGTNASGHGKFEYDVPTGYTALSTKGLNE